MNRRKFFKWLGVGSMAAVVAPSTLLPMEPSLSDGFHYDTIQADKLFDPTLIDYANYANFSAFTIASSIDGCVSDAAQELAHRSGLMLNEVVKHVDNRI